MIEQQDSLSQMSTATATPACFQPIEDLCQYPNNLLVSIKSTIPGHFQRFGTGNLLSSKYCLTCAHNVQGTLKKLEELKNRRIDAKDLTEVHQGLKENCNFKFQISKYHFSPNYKPKQEDEDFVLLELLQTYHKGKSINQTNRFMPIVALQEQTLYNSKAYLKGYPVQLNQKLANNQNQQRIQMNFEFQVLQKIIKVTQKTIQYQNPTEAGFSGASLITQYKGQWVIAGVHKGGNAIKNVAVNAGLMLEHLNKLGKQLQGKPFVYTERTFDMREELNKIKNSIILILIDRYLEARDILVLTAFDLSKMIKISLSGNYIGDHGVKYLLRRQFPNLISLYLHENNIQNLPQADWNNVQNVQYLGLSLNELEMLPLGMTELRRLKELWVSNNKIEAVPKEFLQEICKNSDLSKQQSKIYIYDNLINLTDQAQLINDLSKSQNTRIFWRKNEASDNVL